MTNLKYIIDNLNVNLTEIDKFHINFKEDMTLLEQRELKKGMNGLFRLILLLEHLKNNEN